MKEAILVGGAPGLSLEGVSVASDTLLIGVDRGTLHLLAKGQVPTVAIGDFDSVNGQEWEQIQAACPQIVKLSTEKDETDMEAAIDLAVAKGAEKITIYGALGGRIDHTMANIRLLQKTAGTALETTIADPKNRLRLLVPGTHQLFSGTFKYQSFFAVGKTVENLTLIGLKYPLSGYRLKQEDIRCTSNESLGEAFTVSFTTGYLLMIQSKD